MLASIVVSVVAVICEIIGMRQNKRPVTIGHLVAMLVIFSIPGVNVIIVLIQNEVFKFVKKVLSTKVIG
jgi:hypothetical protein